jgi:hypothetical protein
MPVNHLDGPQVTLADLPLAVPFDSVRQYEDYIARLHQVPRVFTQTEEVLRAGMADGLMPVRFLLEKIPAQCQGTVAADPFLLPTRHFPADIAPDDQRRLTKAIYDAVVDEVLPAYMSFASFIAEEYARTGSHHTHRDFAARRHAALRERHQEPHDGQLSSRPMRSIRLACARLQRIRGGHARDRAPGGLCGSGVFSRKSLKTNPKYIPTSAEQIVDDFRKLHRTDAAQTAAALRLHSELTRHR